MIVHHFDVYLHSETRHKIGVVIHDKLSAMRRFLRSRGHESKTTNACCFQPHKFDIAQQLVAEIHFAKDCLNLDTIAHECSHAAFHRCLIIGVPFLDDYFQERLATDTGSLTNAVVKYLENKKFKVKLKKIV